MNGLAHSYAGSFGRYVRAIVAATRAALHAGSTPAAVTVAAAQPHPTGDAARRIAKSITTNRATAGAMKTPAHKTTPRRHFH